MAVDPHPDGPPSPAPRLRALAWHWQLLGGGSRRGVTVDMRAVLERKRAALGCPRCQMERLIDDPPWSTLEDVADGRLLSMSMESPEAFAERRS